MVCRKGKVCLGAKWPIMTLSCPAGAYPGFCGMERLGVFPLPPDGKIDHHMITPSVKFAGAQLKTWLERGIVRVKCPAQEHNTI